MWFPTRRAVFVGLAAASAQAGMARAQHSPDAWRVIQRAKQAMGGEKAWNSLRGVHQTGRLEGQAYERWSDPVRYGDRFDVVTPAGEVVRAYNGAYEWMIAADGQVSGGLDKAMQAKMRTEAFFAAYAYFFPSRFDLRSSHLGARTLHGRSFDVLRVQPAGGRPRELWFDRSTGLLGQMVEEADGGRTAVEYADYRKTGPVRLPFTAVTTGGDLKAPQHLKLERIDFPSVDRALFTWVPGMKR